MKTLKSLITFQYDSESVKSQILLFYKEEAALYLFFLKINWNYKIIRKGYSLVFTLVSSFEKLSKEDTVFAPPLNKVLGGG